MENYNIKQTNNMFHSITIGGFGRLRFLAEIEHCQNSSKFRMLVCLSSGISFPNAKQMKRFVSLHN